MEITLFKTLPRQGEVIPTPRAAKERLLAMAEALRSKDYRLTPSEAWKLVVATPEGERLYRLMHTTDQAIRNSGERRDDVQADINDIKTHPPAVPTRRRRSLDGAQVGGKGLCVDVLDRARRAIAKSRPADLDSAIRAVMKRDGVDYAVAARRAGADPANAELVAKWQAGKLPMTRIIKHG